jgi:hypothetical protein
MAVLSLVTMTEEIPEFLIVSKSSFPLFWIS